MISISRDVRVLQRAGAYQALHLKSAKVRGGTLGGSAGMRTQVGERILEAIDETNKVSIHGLLGLASASSIEIEG